MVQRKLLRGVDDGSGNRIFVGNGYAIEWVGEKHLIVYRYGVAYKKIEIKTGLDRRRLVVELVLEAGVTKSRLARALNVSRQSIDNWVDTFKKAGFEGLVNSYKGSREKGRKENSKSLPTGNKARQLEEERRREREESQKQQLMIEFEVNESGGSIEQADVFNESHEFQPSRYGGGFLYWGIFQYVYGFMGLCESYLGRHSIVVYLFAMMLVHGINSVEQLKCVFKREFGKVIGIKQLFSKPVLWRLIHNACNLRATKGLIEGFFERQARKGLVALYWLYIDGHFIPYYGKEEIHKGYYTQQDQMMAGQTEIFVHDIHGQVVYFDLQEGKGDLKGMMRRMSDKCSGHLGGTYPLLIADRECWGVEHFLSMKGYRFVTWEKFSEAQELRSISEECFSPVFEVNDTKYQCYEDNKRYTDDENNSIELRRIVIWNKKTGRRSACVAQDEDEDSITLARAMLGRWGCSENSFKHMGDRFKMHYNPVLDASEESEKQDVINPEYKRLKKEIRNLKKKLERCERNIGRLPLTKNKDGSLRKSRRRDRLLQETVEVQEKLGIAQKELDACPERVNLKEVKGETFKQLDTEGKNLWDVAQWLVWNSRKKLKEILKEFLPNQRDLLPVLEAITSSRGWVRSTREVIEVRLEPLDTPRFRAAQIQLCRALNEKQIRLNNGKRLLYDVGPEPKSV